MKEKNDNNTECVIILCNDAQFALFDRDVPLALSRCVAVFTTLCMVNNNGKTQAV